MTFMRAKHVHKGSQDGLIKDVQKQGKKRASPQLFSLSSLQSAMNKRYHAGFEFGVAVAFSSFPTRSLLSRVLVFAVGNLHHEHIEQS